MFPGFHPSIIQVDNSNKKRVFYIPCTVRRAIARKSNFNNTVRVAIISYNTVYIYIFFPALGLCSLFARAKMLYRRLVDDVIEIVVLLHTSYFS